MPSVNNQSMQIAITLATHKEPLIFGQPFDLSVSRCFPVCGAAVWAADSNGVPRVPYRFSRGGMLVQEPALRSSAQRVSIIRGLRTTPAGPRLTHRFIERPEGALMLLSSVYGHGCLLPYASSGPYRHQQSSRGPSSATPEKGHVQDHTFIRVQGQDYTGCRVTPRGKIKDFCRK